MFFFNQIILGEDHISKKKPQEGLDFGEPWSSGFTVAKCGLTPSVSHEYIDSTEKAQVLSPRPWSLV